MAIDTLMKTEVEACWGAPRAGAAPRGPRVRSQGDSQGWQGRAGPTTPSDEAGQARGAAPQTQGIRLPRGGEAGLKLSWEDKFRGLTQKQLEQMLIVLHCYQVNYSTLKPVFNHCKSELIPLKATVPWSHETEKGETGLLAFRKSKWNMPI